MSTLLLIIAVAWAVEGLLANAANRTTDVPDRRPYGGFEPPTRGQRERERSL